METTRIKAYAVKSRDVFAMSGAVDPGTHLLGTDYRRLLPHRQLYSNADRYETLRVRGQTREFQQDAVAALDMAPWDIRGQATGLSLADMLGARLRDALPCYATGFREKSAAAPHAEATEWARQGFGAKACMGFDARSDAIEIAGLRDAMGNDATLAIEGVWRCTPPGTQMLARTLEKVAVAFFESPITPEDSEGHRELTSSVDIPIAVGNQLRARHRLLPWFTKRALNRLYTPGDEVVVILRNADDDRATVAADVDPSAAGLRLMRWRMRVYATDGSQHDAGSYDARVQLQTDPGPNEVLVFYLEHDPEAP